METSYEEIVRVSKALDPESEIRDIFYPMMSFFFDTDPAPESLKKFKDLSEDPAFDAAILELILSFKK